MKCNSKALVLLVLAITVLGFSITLTPTYAEENAPQTYLNARYNYTYTEVTDENHVTTRVYDTKSQPRSNSSTYGLVNEAAKTKAILSSLGMGEDFIDALSAEDLADYAASESITATVSYTQTDEDGNVINISEEDAEAAVASVGPSPWEDMIDFPGDGGGSGLTPVEENEGTYEEEGLGALGVLKLTFVVSYWGDDKYHFSVDGEWLTMPKYRGYDSLGACAQYMSLPGEGDNASGWYSYESVELAWGEFQDQTTEKYSIPSSSFGRPTTDGWNGVGATFNLPDDDTSMDVPLAEFYYSFKVHIGFDIEVASPDTSWNIDPRATYSQHTLGFDYDAGLKITASGVDAELGLNVAIMKHNYTIRLTNGLDYVPDGD